MFSFDVMLKMNKSISIFIPGHVIIKQILKFGI